MMALKKAVITSAGLGSRMREITNVLPKSLIPLYKAENSKKILVPIIDFIFASISNVGIDDICIVAGDKEHLIKKHLEEKKIKNVRFVSQHPPKGFGAAVLAAEKFSSGDPFMLNTDDIVLTSGYDVLSGLFKKLNPDALFFIREVGNPKRYGVAVVEEEDVFMNHKVFRVTDVEEKPANPKSNFAIIGLYAFSGKIFKALRDSSSGENVELTPAIEQLIKDGGRVYAILIKDEVTLNVGDPENYFKAMSYTFNEAEKMLKP